MEKTTIDITQKTEVFRRLGREYFRVSHEMNIAKFAQPISIVLKFKHMTAGIVRSVDALGYDTEEFLQFYEDHLDSWAREMFHCGELK